jgi:hypothetical protein
LEFLSWKTGEGIAIEVGGATSMTILVVVVAVTVADGIMVAVVADMAADAITALHRVTARRALRNSHRGRRSRQW